MILFSRLKNVLTSSKNRDILTRSLINLLRAKGYDDVSEQTILISLEDSLKNQLDELKGPQTRYLVSTDLLVSCNVHIVQGAIKIIENLEDSLIYSTSSQSAPQQENELIERQHRVIRRQEVKVDRIMSANEDNHNVTKDRNMEDIFSAKKVTPKNFWDK